MRRCMPPRPIPPRPEDCCGTGCVHCIYVVYDIALTEWEREAARILAQTGPPLSTPASAAAS